MIRQIQALNYRCLRYVSQQLDPFQVLVGPNASGKTTFLDVVSFLGSVVSNGLAVAVEERTSNFSDLVWQRGNDPFELSVELAIPSEKKVLLGNERFDTVRYELQIGLDIESNQVAILSERVLLKVFCAPARPQRSLFPEVPNSPLTILTPKGERNSKTVVSKVCNANDNFYSEVSPVGSGGWIPPFKLGPYKSALGNLPEDEKRFPVATWLKQLLSEGVQSIVLNSLLMRLASPPGQSFRFKPDGANLPWVLADFVKRDDRYRGWIAHLRTALGDLEGVRTVEREDDKHRYLLAKYSGGLEVPSWMLSDGTLRLMALTLPAYLTGLRGVYLIEEPENGIHPRAVETLFESLSSVYEAQILVATHSPVMLSLAKSEQILCFKKADDGATDIVRGSDHPALRDWQHHTDLGVLFAAGVLG
jgi:predicted ATPase